MGVGCCFVSALVKSSPLPEGPHRRQLQSGKVAYHFSLINSVVRSAPKPGAAGTRR